jgi:hypothetical protein
MDIFIRLFEEVAAIPAFSRHLSMTRVEIRHHFSSISMEDLCKDVGYMVLYLCTLQFNVRLVFLCNLLAFALQVRALGESSGVMGDCGRLLTEVLALHKLHTIPVNMFLWNIGYLNRRLQRYTSLLDGVSTNNDLTDSDKENYFIFMNACGLGSARIERFFKYIYCRTGSMILSLGVKLFLFSV